MLLSRLTASPYFAVGLLVIAAILVSTALGVSALVWPFFLIGIIYIGGIMVLFLYITSLITSAKISWLATPRAPWVLLILLRVVLTRRAITSDAKNSVMWTEQIITLNCLFISVFLILFLLVNLLTVCSLCQKYEGPIKSLTKTIRGKKVHRFKVYL